MNYFLGLGSNLGNRLNYLNLAKEQLIENNFNIINESSIIETEPFGVKDQPKFLNQVIEVEIDKNSFEVLEIIHSIETKLGRQRLRKWGERTIDIDILFCENNIIDENDLIVPHPGIIERKFVLQSLNELIPDFVHPTINMTIKELYKNIDK